MGRTESSSGRHREVFRASIDSELLRLRRAEEEVGRRSRARLVLVGARRSTKRFPRGGARARFLAVSQLYWPLGVAVAGWRLKPQNVTCWFFLQSDLASWGNSPGLWSQTSLVEVNSWL